MLIDLDSSINVTPRWVGNNKDMGLKNPSKH